MDARLSELSIGEIDNPVSVWLSADAAKNATNPVGFGAENMNARHNGGVIASYLDTHVVYSKNINDVTYDSNYAPVLEGAPADVSYTAGTGFKINADAISFNLIPSSGYKAVSATVSKQTTDTWANDGKTTNAVKKSPNEADKLRPGMSYAINVKGVTVPTLGANDSITITVQVYMGVNTSGGDSITKAQPVGRPYVYPTSLGQVLAANKFDIKSPPIYAAPAFVDLQEYAGGPDQNWDNTVLYPVVTVKSVKTGTTVNIESVDLVTMGH